MRRAVILTVVGCALASGLLAQTNTSPPPLRDTCPVLGPDGHWDEASQWLAGLSVGAYGDDATVEQKQAWSVYSKGITSDWKGLKRDYLDRIEGWRKKSLGSANSNVAFYPFSGPDAANALAFFPEAKEYVLVGLEPIGCIPRAPADYGDTYLADLRQSLRSAVALGFFRTEDMKRDFHESQVTGVLPVLLLAIVRSGNSIVEAAPVGINAAGSVIPRTEGAKIETRGVAIRFQDNKHGLRTLRYFSLNLENSALQKKPGTLKYLQNPPADTLVKSASYLMHKLRFSTIRAAILARSNVVIQDDSGVPFRLFPATAWDNHFYGTYTKPISMFKDSYQDDLAAAFAAPTNVQPLEFGIGYKWRRNESNLMVAFRKK